MPIGKLTVEVPINDLTTLQAVLTAMIGAAAPSAPGPVSPPVPVPVPVPVPPVGVNAYPLTMTPVTNPGDPVTIGVGPDTLQMRLNAGVALGDGAELAVVLNGNVIAAPLTVTGHAGMDLGQIFSIRGNFGAPQLIGWASVTGEMVRAT